MSRSAGPALPLLVALALAVPTVLAARAVHAGLATDRPYEVTLVPRGDALRFASPAIRLSFGNLYWLSTVQYLGDSEAHRRGVPKLLPLVDLVTDLDPQHGYAYQTAGIVLSGYGRLDESERILRKGMERGPNWWSYPYYIAFNHFFYRGDYAEGARWAEIAAKTPGASPNVSHLALAMRVKSGDPDHAILFLAELRDTAKDDVTAQALEEQYKLALLQRDFRVLDAAVEAFRAARGRPPARLQELVAAGLVDRIPANDPFGGTYELRDGQVHATGRDHRFAPPEQGRLHLQRQAAPSPLLPAPPHTQGAAP